MRGLATISGWALLMAGTCLSVSLAQATPVYRSVDAQGNVTFSDRPIGEKVEVGPVNTVPSRPVTSTQDVGEAREAPAAGEAEASAFTPYERLRITAPANESTLPTGAAGDTQVSVAIVPALRDAHRLRLMVDGEVRQAAQQATTFSLNDLVRGEHTLRAEVIDAEGRVLQRSAPVTLYVQRASVYLPANPNNPRNSGGSGAQ
ncbi:DUF4124 domain-containing protein [Chromohalobacter sp. HP20-39]|uniref:DUF4124 domain-containing protein n=1 Tax=Chromohalobacter sp. HP20-39 TaxID=3079306 RepID=UPI00294B40A6|nr:DUF4124 domain-containing protein [Chromohalobacter sp. HP20-39]MDV6318203.1 DUF4124 domain-containing protein [Chromohalobacter sp. HP20-39]